MNKHLRAKVASYINRNASAFHRISDNEEIRAHACLRSMSLHKSDGSQEEWLSPFDSDSTKYFRNSELFDNGCNPTVVALRYNWAYVYPVDSSCLEQVPYPHSKFFLTAWEYEIDGVDTCSRLFVSDNPFLLRSFVAVLIKRRVIGLHFSAEHKNVVFATHLRGCCRIEHNGNGIITSVRDVRIGAVTERGHKLRSRSECLHYLYDAEDSSANLPVN